METIGRNLNHCVEVCRFAKGVCRSAKNDDPAFLGQSIPVPCTGDWSYAREALRHAARGSARVQVQLRVVELTCVNPALGAWMARY